MSVDPTSVNTKTEKFNVLSEAPLSASGTDFSHLDTTISHVQYIYDCCSECGGRNPQMEMLQGALHPLRKLPPEILVEVFQHCKETIALPTKRLPMPFAIAQVCSKWRELVLATSSLWNDILIDFQDWSDPIRLTNKARMFLSRSGTSPISLDSRSRHRRTGEVDAVLNPVINLVVPLRTRLKELSLSLPSVWLKEFLSLPPGEVELLQSAHLDLIHDRINGLPTMAYAVTVFEAAPHLHTLTLKASRLRMNLNAEVLLCLPPRIKNLHFVNIGVPCATVYTILRQCNHIVTCTLTFAPHSDAHISHCQQIILPNLSSLTVDVAAVNGYDHCLRPFILPSLDQLTIIGTPMSWLYSCFASLITRSLCSLRYFSTSMTISSTDIQALLKEMPELLELSLTGSFLSSSMLETMSRGELIPKLEALAGLVDGSALDDFINMLECRWSSGGASPTSYTGLLSAAAWCSVDFDTLLRARDRVRSFGTKADDIRLYVAAPS